MGFKVFFSYIKNEVVTFSIVPCLVSEECLDLKTISVRKEQSSA
jgi:hypothetical protein